jgi:predicted transcriptional regulator
VKTPPIELPQSPGLRQLEDFITEPNRDWSKLAARAVALRILGYSQKAIAAEMCASEHAVRQWLMQARKRAELLDVGPLLDHVALPLAVDNLIEGLQQGNEKYTLATLQGRGAFSAHSKSENYNTDMTLEIRVEMTDRSKPIDAIEGQVVGVPRQLAETVDA